MISRFFLQALYPSLVWRIPVNEKIIFLTFDDGPIPEVTPWVLDLLKANGVHATFFCVGENVTRSPYIFRRILNEGHGAANHTARHLNGWKTDVRAFVKDVEECTSVMEPRPRLFRPPYGRIRPSQIRALSSRYRIVMWDVITRDWNPAYTANDCFERVRRRARPGSIIVFHDSLKAADRMKPALERTLRHCRENGYRFDLLENYL